MSANVLLLLLLVGLAVPSAANHTAADYYPCDNADGPDCSNADILRYGIVPPPQKPFLQGYDDPHFADIVRHLRRPAN